MSEAKTIVVLPGDGIGPEITAEAVRVTQAAADKVGLALEFSEHLIGGAAIDATGAPFPSATREAAQAADAILLGAVGGPKWDDPQASVRPEQGLLAIRKSLGLFANLRPIKVWRELADASPLKAERLEGVDLLCVRELTGGIYFGQPRRTETDEGGRRALDTLVYADWEIARIVRLACEAAQGRSKRVVSVDKANVLDSSRLWRRVADEVAAGYPDVALTHQLVDSCAMRLVTHAAEFDVLVTGNMFGDILSDMAGVLPGSLGVLPSASLGEGSRGLYEPSHGSAPDIAGQGIANPIGTILSAALMLRYSLGAPEAAAAIESAVGEVIAAGNTTPDLGGVLSTSEVGAAVVDALSKD